MNISAIPAHVVAKHLSMPRTIELMKQAYVALSSGEVDAPIRTALSNPDGTVLYKPAYSKNAGIFCAKIVSVFSANTEKNLPVTPGLIVVNSATTGMPIAMVEASYLTSLRTGAGVGLATDIFAEKGAKVAALFGTGGQARHQLEAMLAVRDFKTIYIFSRNSKNANHFCEVNSDLAGKCQLIANPDRSILKNCDVITTATSSATPLFKLEEISATCHINAIGSLGKWRTEVSADTLLSSRVIVDHRAACLAEAGEICLMRDAGLISADYHPEEIGECILADWKSEDHKSERTVFKSIGNAVQDLVCVAELLDKVDGLDEVVL